jgi:pyridoxine 4-dehydrogenase
MPKLDARKSGSFKIGGDIEIHRLGFGATRVTGPGIWGPPVDRAEAIRTLKRVPKLGIDFIDTADSYGPEVSEELIREVLYPYDGMLIATKGGLRRPRAGIWERDGRPKYLRQQAIQSCQRLGLDLNRSNFGSSTALIQKCRATSSSRPSSHFKTMASSVTLG